MQLFADLTPAQREAVGHVYGPLLVLAGAGSGKTRVITRRIAHMLSRGIAGRSILALTFTNKAAGEMRQRVESLVPGSGVWLGTFHGLCARLLRQYAPLVGLEPGFTIYDQADRLRTIKGVMERLGLDSVGVSAEQVEGILSRAKNDLRTDRPRGLGGGDDHVSAVAARVLPAYEEAMRAASAVDFDDLLVHIVTVVREHPSVRAALDDRFRYILVDEYQDTNLAQYAILRALAVDHPNLCVTGDPDQSIYGWRGANLNNILEFEHDYPGCTVVKLERNYRSTKTILRVADHLITHNKRRKAKGLTTENPVGQPVALTIYGSETEEARGVASRIVDLVQEGTRSHRDIAIFCRVTALTRHLELALRAAQVPYQIVGGVAFYERQEIKDVLAYLNLISNPKDDLAFLRVVNTPPRGLGKVTLDRLGEQARAQGLPLLAMTRQAGSIAGIKDRAARGLRDFVLLIDELTAYRDHPAEEVLRKVLTMSGYHAHLEAEAKSEGEDRLANVDELVSAARQYDSEHPGASVLEFLEEVSLASAVDRWDDDTGVVTLMTLHAAKGLEFPVVFIVGLEQGILPHARSGEGGAEIEEERRLLFVGITRARQELYLSHCRVREFRGQRTATVPSRFLAELPDDAIEERDLTGGPRIYAPARPRMATNTGFRLVTAAELAGGRAAAEPGDALAAFRPGTRVLHPEFGLGRIVSIDGAGPNRKGRVAFAVGGERTFVLAKSPLKPVGG
jgi:DNA helicase-2/ATP-dependent DNA helicase PcrA